MMLVINRMQTDVPTLQLCVKARGLFCKLVTLFIFISETVNSNNISACTNILFWKIKQSYNNIHLFIAELKQPAITDLSVLFSRDAVTVLFWD